MKININSKELQKKVQAVSGAIHPNPIIPILENVLIESDGEVIEITGSDLNNTVITKLELKADKGSFCIPSKLLLDVLKNLPEQPIEVQVNEKFECTIIVGKSKYKIACENTINFPKIPALEGKEIVLKSDILLNAINTASWACSTDELRPSMTGMLFEGNGECIDFCALDTLKLVHITNPIADIEIKAIIGKKQLNILKSILPLGLDVSIFVTDKNISFKFGEIEIIGQVINEKYPPYKSVIPKADKNLELNKQELINSIKRVSLFSNKTTNMVKFSISETELIITSEDLDYSHEGSETIDISFLHNFEIGINAKHLLEILPNVKGELITASFSESDKAILIKGSADNELFLTMPVMLNK